MRFSFILFFLIIIFTFTACSSNTLDTPLITAKEREAFETRGAMPRNFEITLYAVEGAETSLNLIYKDGKLYVGHFTHPIGAVRTFPPSYEQCLYDASWNSWRDENDKQTPCSISPDYLATVEQIQEFIQKNSIAPCDPTYTIPDTKCYAIELPPSRVQLPNNFVITIQNNSDQITVSYKDGKMIQAQHDYDPEALLNKEEQVFTSLDSLETQINTYLLLPCGSYLYVLNSYAGTCYYLTETTPLTLPETFIMHVFTDDTSSAALRTFNATFNFEQNLLVNGTAHYYVDGSGGTYSEQCSYDVTNQKWLNKNGEACEKIQERLTPVTTEHLTSLIDTAILKPDDGSCHGVYCYTVE